MLNEDTTCRQVRRMRSMEGSRHTKSISFFFPFIPETLI